MCENILKLKNVHAVELHLLSSGFWALPHSHHISEWGFIRRVKTWAVMRSDIWLTWPSIQFQPWWDWLWHRDVSAGRKCYATHLSYKSKVFVFSQICWLLCLLTYRLIIVIIWNNLNIPFEIARNTWCINTETCWMLLWMLISQWKLKSSMKTILFNSAADIQ